VVRLGGVPINSRSALGAEVAVTRVEIECADAVFAASTLELYAPFAPIGSVVCHRLIVVLSSESKDTPRWAVEGNESVSRINGHDCCNKAITRFDQETGEESANGRYGNKAVD